MLKAWNSRKQFDKYKKCDFVSFRGAVVYTGIVSTDNTALKIRSRLVDGGELGGNLFGQGASYEDDNFRVFYVGRDQIYGDLGYNRYVKNNSAYEFHDIELSKDGLYVDGVYQTKIETGDYPVEFDEIVICGNPRGGEEIVFADVERLSIEQDGETVFDAVPVIVENQCYIFDKTRRRLLSSSNEVDLIAGWY